MSKYTTEVRFICEENSGMNESQGGNKVNEILLNSWEKIFDFEFPIFNEEYRSVLCQKILKHYYTREIGFETAGLWKLKLDTRLNEIMPYYNNLYKSAELEFNPLYDADYRKIHEGSGDSETNVNTSSGSNGSRSDTNSGTNYRLFSDTPQGSLTGVNNENYLTDATKFINNGNSNSSYNENTNSNGDTVYSSTDQYVDHVIGKFPGRSYASLIKEYREALINVDMMVIEALSDLFMKLW